MKPEIEVPNFAKDEDFAREIQASGMATWNALRVNREERERRWLDAYEHWTADPNQEASGRMYKGRANLMTPQLRKEIETMSRRIIKGLFQDDYLKAVPTRFENDEICLTNTLMVRHFIENVMQMRHALMPWVKQGVCYGTSPLRSYWRKQENMQMFRKREFKVDDQGIMQPKFKKAYENVVLYNGPVVEAADMFQTWIYPENAPSPSHIEAVFFRTKITLEQLRKKEKEGTAILRDGIEDQGKEIDEEYQRTQERLVHFGSSGMKQSLPGQKYFDLLEMWSRLEVPLKGGKKAFIPCITEFVNGTIVRIQQNPFWFQAPPFDFMRYIIPMPGEFYGRGLPEAIGSLQYQLDDVLNQTMDSVTLSLQPVTVINPAFAPNADSFEVEPRAIWWADPDAVKPFQFPDISQSGMNNASQIRSMISELSDNSPQLPDPIAGKARSTGQAQLAVNEWQTDLWNFIDQVSSEALSPLAKKIHILLQQNLDDDTVYRVAGKHADSWVERYVSPTDLVGNLDFRWVGSIQIQSQSVKTQQLLSLMKILPMVPAGSVNVNWPAFVTRVMRDGFQMGELDNIIETDYMKNSTDPTTENKIIRLGGQVDTSPSDDDQSHIQTHTLLAQDPKQDPYIRAVTLSHIQKHQEQIQKKQQAQQEQQMQMQIMAAQAAAKQGKQNMKQMNPNAKPPNPMGNQAQLSESTNPADLQRGIKA